MGEKYTKSSRMRQKESTQGTVAIASSYNNLMMPKELVKHKEKANWM